MLISTVLLTLGVHDPKCAAVKKPPVGFKDETGKTYFGDPRTPCGCGYPFAVAVDHDVAADAGASEKNGQTDTPICDCLLGMAVMQARAMEQELAQLRAGASRDSEADILAAVILSGILASGTKPPPREGARVAKRYAEWIQHIRSDDAEGEDQ